MWRRGVGELMQAPWEHEPSSEWLLSCRSSCRQLHARPIQAFRVKFWTAFKTPCRCSRPDASALRYHPKRTLYLMALKLWTNFKTFYWFMQGALRYSPCHLAWSTDLYLCQTTEYLYQLSVLEYRRTGHRPAKRQEHSKEHQEGVQDRILSGTNVLNGGQSTRSKWRRVGILRRDVCRPHGTEVMVWWG